MGTDTLALQVAFVYTHHLYYYRSIQHMTVLRVVHTHTPITNLTTTFIHNTTLNVGTVQA